MSGVWVFKNGINRLEEGGGGRAKALVHTPTNEVITSYEDLERHLTALGWERFDQDPTLLQFNKKDTVELISLPAHFARFKSLHMYDIVIKNRNMFEVRDL